MATTIESSIVRLRKRAVDAAGRVLARAFVDDPLFVYVAPDEAQRRTALTPIMTTGVKIGMAAGGEVYRPFAALEGAAIWMPPWHPHVGEDEVREAGGHQMGSYVDEPGMARWGQAMRGFDEQRAKAMGDFEHWYLMVLGVEPALQGRGVGPRLIAPVLARADEARLPCYLETCKERNLAFYEKQGFEVTGECATADDGLRFWGMRREPRRTGGG